MTECKSFAPQINKNSRILILGSMPGIKSLQMQEYYAHPQNRFWKLMGIICGFDNLHETDYKNKIQVLLDNKIALWDVIKFCRREGSLDTNIENEIPNDIEKLLRDYPNIKKICLNGNKAYTAFKKYFPDILISRQCCKMPSTSPANAKFRLEDLYKEWQVGLSDN